MFLRSVVIVMFFTALVGWAFLWKLLLAILLSFVAVVLAVVLMVFIASLWLDVPAPRKRHWRA